MRGLGPAFGLSAIAVSAQIGSHNCEFLRQSAHNFMPHNVRLRITVQKQQRRAGTACPAGNFRFPRLDTKVAKFIKDGHFEAFGSVSVRRV